MAYSYKPWNLSPGYCQERWIEKRERNGERKGVFGKRVLVRVPDVVDGRVYDVLRLS